MLKIVFFKTDMRTNKNQYLRINKSLLNMMISSQKHTLKTVVNNNKPSYSPSKYLRDSWFI